MILKSFSDTIKVEDKPLPPVQAPPPAPVLSWWEQLWRSWFPRAK